MAAKFSSRPPLAQRIPRRILIIGGGAAGLAALRALSDTHGGAEALPWEEVALYERRKDVGGVWYLDPDTAAYERSLPSGTADGQWPIRPSGSSAPLWPSPSYPALRGNVLPRFLSFSSLPFPPPAGGETFPTLDETHAYLRAAAEGVRGNVRCGIEVRGVWELGREEEQGWAVRVRDWNKAGEERVEFWDAVVVASGWYDSPIYPPVPGLSSAVDAGLVHHAKWYRTPSTYSLPRFASRTVVVVGNGNSANDAAAHLAAARGSKERPVLRSVLEAARPVFVSLPDERIRDVPAVREYRLRTDEQGEKRLDLELVDGTVVKDTVVLLGVGYETGTIPFVHLLSDAARSPSRSAFSSASSSSLSSFYKPLTPPARLSQPRPSPSPLPPGDADIVDAWPFRLPNLHMHCVHAINPSLTFVGLPVTNTPFVLADLHAWYIRSIYELSLPLPSSRAARSADEAARVSRLLARRAEVAALDASLRADWLRAREAGDEEALSQAAPPQVGPEAYHVIVSYNEEQAHALALRREVVRIRPWLDEQLDSWDDERERERKGMYARKLETLKRWKRKEEEEKVKRLCARH